MNDSISQQFLLDPQITFLNFGSFGACPKPVMNYYQQLQLEQEKDPVAFFADKGPEAMKLVRKTLAQYLNATAEDIVCVNNPTYAVNIIAKNFNLQKDDEVLSTNLEYGACCKTWEYYCEKAGAKFIKSKITLPIVNEASIIAAIESNINKKTKLIFISHITSVTALIMPIESIINLGKHYNLPVFVDGAHAPGHIAVDLAKLDCDFYTGACHKWMLAPKGTSFLYAKKAYHKLLDPLAISWGFKSAYTSGSILVDHHELQGTRDICGFLSIPKAIEFMAHNNWVTVSNQCKELVLQNVQTLANLLDCEPLAPLVQKFFGQMCSLPLYTEDAMLLHAVLYKRFKIQIPIPTEDGNTYIRYSINAFNKQADLDALFEAIKILKQEGIIQPIKK